MIGEKYLSWTFSDQKQSNENEDVKARNQRENVELSKALAVLGIRPSTFHSFQSSGNKKKVQKLLDNALMARTEDKHERLEDY